MEANQDRKQSILAAELIQGLELAKQLNAHLPATSSSALLKNLHDSFDRALRLLKCRGTGPRPSSGGNGSAASRRGDGSDRDRPKDCSRQQVFKKRKMGPEWSKEARIPHGDGVAGAFHGDRCSWRKYGQKMILGARFPRGYYRCRHWPALGCLATKHVQRSDHDASLLQITYQGTHSCGQPPRSSPPPPPAPPVEDIEGQARKEDAVILRFDRAGGLCFVLPANSEHDCFTASAACPWSGLDEQSSRSDLPGVPHHPTGGCDQTLDLAEVGEDDGVFDQSMAAGPIWGWDPPLELAEFNLDFPSDATEFFRSP